ncbi:MAG: hypothetical protein P1V36_11035 [Planctomycetota bacterium]|nr:hypothetical protein [Planctomycetota bacterium]
MPARGLLLALACVPVLLLGAAQLTRLAAEELPTHAPLDPEGGVHVDARGQARFLFTPEFRGAAWLKQQLALHPLKGLQSDLVSPVLAVAPARGSRTVPAPSPGRILLQGPPAMVTQARELLARLDLAERAVFVSLLIGEVDRSDKTSTGGSMLFDKSAGPNPEGTVFRGAAMGFEPEEYLRSSLTGAIPFEGTSLTFGNMDAGGGAFEYTLRMLQRRGEAEFLAWPSLLCNEGEPGEMNSIELLPQFITDTIDRNNTTLVSRGAVETGLKLRVTPVRIGAESAVLDIAVWMQLPTDVNDGSAAPGTVRLRKREVTTRLTVRDREPLFFGGIVLKHGEKGRRGLPRPRELAVLDPIHSARMSRCTETEVVLLVRARIVPLRVRPPEIEPQRYRGWTEVGPRAGANNLPAPWDQAKHPSR